jgi:mannose-6-phosphate isomerase-like protein (cupin superfamily)
MKTTFGAVGHFNIELETEENELFRRVVHTTPNLQVVLMSLKPWEDIGDEVHPYSTQFFRVEHGSGIAIVDNIRYRLTPGIALIVPLNTTHNIINNGTGPLRLYSIYSPPVHHSEKLDVTKPTQDTD